jgi:hypothetical protein
MNEEREWPEPAARSMATSKSFESVMDVFDHEALRIVEWQEAGVT